VDKVALFGNRFAVMLLSLSVFPRDMVVSYDIRIARQRRALLKKLCASERMQIYMLIFVFDDA
jgi:hypothetical protein